MRAIKNLFVLVIIVAMLVGVGAVALRVMRGKPSGVEEIKQGIVMASSVSSYVYAAKVGNKVILFDAGADPDGKPIDALLGWLHAGRGDITDVFFSHGHGDHTAGAAGLRNVHFRLGAGDIALAEKKVPPEAFAGKAFTTVMSFPARRPSRSATRNPAKTAKSPRRWSRRSRSPVTPPARTRSSTTACCSWATR